MLLIDEESRIKLNINVNSVEKTFTIEREQNRTLPIKADRNELVSFLLSSGSSGDPKVICKTNAIMMSHLSIWHHKVAVSIEPGDIYLIDGLYHVSGQTPLFECIRVGAVAAISKLPDNPNDIFEAIHKNNVTNALLVPTELNYLIKSDHINRDYLKTLRNVWTAGSTLHQHLYEAILDRFEFDRFQICILTIFNHVKYLLLLNFSLMSYLGYGTTEIGSITITRYSDANNIINFDTVGKAAPGSEIKIIDEHGTSLGPNCSGQLCVKVEQVSNIITNFIQL